MIRNYFKIAWRNLLNKKAYSMINIMGLAIGMAVSILIFFWIQNELSFDQFHEKKERLYEVYGLTNSVNGSPVAINETSQPLGPALEQKFAEVEASTRLKVISSLLITAGEKSFTGVKGCMVDPTFLEMFTFPLKYGKNSDQLQDISSITITEKLARQLFGNETALGKIIRIDSLDNVIVAGVLKDLPFNTRFDFEYLLPWNYSEKLGQGYSNKSWLSNNTSTFLLLSPNANVDAFNIKIRDVSKVASGRNDVWTHFLFPLGKWHLYTDFENGNPVGGPIETIRLYGLIAAFILLIACINFINLSTARSETRAKEIGIRKVIGADKKLLIGQFITESFLTVIISGVFALLIVQLSLPLFERITGTQHSIHYTSIYFWINALLLVVLTSLLAGGYPAFYLSSFKPINIIKKRFKKSHSEISPRQVLVVIQFSFAIALIIATIVVRNQIAFGLQRDSGYSKNNLIHVNFAGDIERNYPLIKQELLSSGIAVSVTKTMTGITQSGAHSWGIRWVNENPKDTNTTITLFSADADLVSTAGLHLLEGRDIDINQYPTDSFAVLLNESAVKLMGFKNPLGQLLTQAHGKNLKVVGVVKDYILGSPYAEIPPVVIQGPGAWFNTMHIKFSTSNSTAENISKTEKIFRTFNAAYPFDYTFVDQEYALQFEDQERTKAIVGLFALLAIFISCLGLFGLTAYSVEIRVKEIGIRKALGASVYHITKLISFDFIKLVIVSFVIAAPFAWFSMNRWLQNYSYRISIGWITFLDAGLLVIAIALLTVSFQALKAAITNPVKSLRAE